MSSKKVSILIPTYNRATLIERTLRSCLSQSYENFEVIVNDNQSTDTTWAILQEWAKRDPRIKVYQNVSNVGPLGNWQAALEHCDGYYLKILWSDDTLEPHCLKHCVEALDSNPDAGLVYTSTLIHLKDKDIAAYHHPHATSQSSSAYAVQTILGDNLPVSPACCMIRRKDAFFFDFSSFSEEMHAIAKGLGAGPDVYFMLHAASLYSKVLHLPYFLTHFYGDEESLTLAHRPKVNRGYQLCYQYLMESPPSPFFKKVKQVVKREKRKRKLKKLLRLT